MHIQLEIEQIKTGEITLSKASEACNIPKATLHKRMHIKVQSHGRGTATVLSTAFEIVLDSVLNSFAD